jgi:SAM-dependent methyltransferase
VIHVLSSELFGKSLILREFPHRPDIRGIGLTDSKVYADRLAEKFDYVNTYYHNEPILDIKNLPSKPEKEMDFVIASDVFEHVEPPVSVAFQNVYKLLKQGGVFVFTAPYSAKRNHTEEHFPNLHKYEIRQEDGKYVLVNRTKDGTSERFTNLRFHGGPGFVLEMRRFCEAGLREEFKQAGFKEPKIYAEPVPEFGIVPEGNWSHPMAARK